MAKRLTVGDVVFAVRTYFGAAETYRGYVSRVDGAICFVDWKAPHEVPCTCILADNLYRSAHRAVLAYLKEEQERLEAQSNQVEQPGLKQQGKSDAEGENMIFKVKTTELLQHLVRWRGRGYKNGRGYKFAYLEVPDRGGLRLFRAYKGRHGDLKLMTVSEEAAANGEGLKRLCRHPTSIRDSDMWCFHVPTSWSKWIKEPEPGELLVKKGTK